MLVITDGSNSRDRKRTRVVNLYPLGSGVGGEQWQMQGEAESYWSPGLGLKKVERNWCLFKYVTFGLS